MKKIFKINKKEYTPLKNFFMYGSKISSDYILKKKYLKIVNKINLSNNDLKKFIKQLKKK